MSFAFAGMSKKQRMLLNWWTDASPVKQYNGIICDGAIRTGKTLFMSLSFVIWSMNSFNCRNFGMCGKTIGSFRRNVLSVLKVVLPGRGYTVTDRRSDNLVVISRGNVENYYYVFGGKDERSQDLIQGITLAGVLLDEVALMPKSFVEQACARCSVDGSKFWFNCNPEGQLHWFNQEWILSAEDKAILHLHFEMTDNPSLSPEVRRRYKSLYSGVFYDRFIRGLWVSAEGLVYDCFNAATHIVDALPETEGEYYVSSDFGIQNATVFLLWRKERRSERWICLDEYYYSGRDERRQKTVAELTEGLLGMLGGIIPKRIILDPSATALAAELRWHNLNVQLADNDVLAGIADVSTMLKSGNILISAKCKHTIAEFGEYSWDEKAAQHGEDKPVKENDHCMDAVRYFVRTKHLVKKVGEPKYKPIFM